jgi:hypothetical protein
MAPFDPVILQVVGSFASSAMKSAVKDLVTSLVRRTPLSEDAESNRQLERPENRLAIGKRLVDGKEVLAVCLEKEDGPAYNEAIALKAESPEKVVVEVVGLAQSVWPKDEKKNKPEGPWSLEPGSSVGHIDSYAGSLGIFVTFEYPKGPKGRKKGTFKGFTSASHVLGVNNKAEMGDHIVSPARPDSDNDAALKVGVLGSYKPLTHYTQQNDPQSVVNRVDIGVVELDVEVDCTMRNLVVDPARAKELMPITGVLSEDELLAHLDQPVYMVGRTSGFSEGVLLVAALSVYPIRLPNGKSYLYGDTCVVRPKDENTTFSAGGDSGALIYTADGKAAGFLVAGSPTRSFFQPAHSCLKSINAKLIRE